MRTGAIFARGSCRALKWMALFGVVFALGAERAAAQQSVTLRGATLEIDAANSTEGGSTTVTVTLRAEVPEGNPTADPAVVTRASTVAVTVIASALDATDQGERVILEGLGATPAEDDDFSIVGEANGDPTTTLEFEFPANATGVSETYTRTATFVLQTATPDADAEDEGVRLAVNGVAGVDGPDGGSTTVNAVGGTTPLAGGDATPKDIKINDTDTQTYVLALDPATQMPMEGGMVTVSLKAVPEHEQASKDLTLQLDDMMKDLGYTIAISGGTTGAAWSSNMVTLGDTDTTNNVDDATEATNEAEITLSTTKMNDGNRVDDTLTLSAHSGQVGAAMMEDDLAIVLKDNNVLPTIETTFVDGQGMALNPQPTSVTEGMNYMLKLTVVDEDGDPMAAAEDLEVTLTQIGMADPQNDYSLPTSIMIDSGDMSSDPETLEVDLDSDLGDESLVFSAVVAGEDMYGTETKSIPMLLSLTITDATMTHIWVADGAEAAINAAMMEGMRGDGKINVGDWFDITKSALFDSASGYSARIEGAVSDTSVAGVFDGSDTSRQAEFADTIRVSPRSPGTATITITGTAVGPSAAVMDRQVSVDVAEITFDVEVELAPPGPPSNLTANALDGRVELVWNSPNTGGDPSGYEHRVDAGAWNDGDWERVAAGTYTVTYTGLTNGVAYVFEVRAVNDAGESDAVSAKATPEATPVDASQVVTVKSVSAATSVAESGGLEVTVTATVPAGTKGADDKVAPIASKRLYVSFPTDDASIADGEEAEAGDLTILGDLIWEKISRTEKESEASFKFRVAIGQDLDAEDEKFQVSVSIDGDAKKSKVVTVDDAQEQTYVLSLPAAAKGAIVEGKSATLTLEAKPKRTIDIPVTLALEPNDSSKYTLSVANGTFGTTSFETTVSAKADGDRADDTVTVTAYTDRDGEFASLDITITDANALPAVEATLVDKDGKALDPQPESVMEGETVKVMLTVVDKDGKATKAAEKLTIMLMPTGTADASDYRLSSQSIEIASGKESSAAVDLMITEGQDIGDETLMFDAAVGGEAKNGTEKRSVAGVLSLMITDGTQKLVYAKTQEEVEAAIYAAKNAGAGDDMTFTAGEMIEVMGSALFSSAEGVTLSYTAESSMSGVASASVSGGTVMVTAAAEGMADITITAHASMPSGVKILDQTDSGMASVMFPVEVGLEALSIELKGPEDMNLAEGMSAMVTATANRAATVDTMVMLMRDRAMSTAGDDDYMAEAITIMAGEMTGSTMVMAVEDNMAEDMEELVLYGMTEGMAGEVTGEVKLVIWDAAVPALPIIAQLLLAAFLALGGYRRYRRR